MDFWFKNIPFGIPAFIPVAVSKSKAVVACMYFHS
jgi:hypothetical protein